MVGSGGVVNALSVFGGRLVAGGSFITAGGVCADNIAEWDGSSWSALGSGMGGTVGPHVNALTVYDSKLIAGGYFTVAGGGDANYIASWDGSKLVGARRRHGRVSIS